MNRLETAAPISLSIERVSTAERVADALRQRLLSGDIAPGTPMRDVELSARAGVSRTTVREALSVLAREGLLTHSLHRGMEVARLAPADVHDIYAMRRVVELAGAEALIAGSPAVLAGLERALQAMSEATALRDRRGVVAADVTFHTAIAAGLGIRRLQTALEGALMELRLVLSVTDRAYDDLDDQLRRHRYLLDLFWKRSRAAVMALEEHLLHAEELVCTALEAADDQNHGSAAREVPFLLPGAGGASATSGDVRSPIGHRVRDCR